MVKQFTINTSYLSAAFCLCMHTRRLNTPTSHSSPPLICSCLPLASHPFTSPTPRSPFFPSLLFTKVWLSISSGLRQQALMKRPLRQGDPNQISIRMLNIHIGETSKGKRFLISAHKYHLCAHPGPGTAVSAVFSPPAWSSLGLSSASLLGGCNGIIMMASTKERQSHNECLY